MSEKIHIVMKNKHVFTVNGKYVVRDTNGNWIRQAGRWTDNELNAANIHCDYLDGKL